MRRLQYDDVYIDIFYGIMSLIINGREIGFVENGVIRYTREVIEEDDRLKNLQYIMIHLDNTSKRRVKKRWLKVMFLEKELCDNKKFRIGFAINDIVNNFKFKDEEDVDVDVIKEDEDEDEDLELIKYSI
jgi:hypothetical protein